jgi:hypothetical protein
MSFVNLEQAIERERRTEQLMVRLGSLPPEDFNKISQMLQAKSQIDSIVTSTTASVGGGSAVARQMESTLAKSGETITSNLTQLLGFVPTSSDMSQLKLLNEQFGSNFSEATRTISSSIGSIEGGVGKLLQSLDTGVTQGIQSLATAAQNSLNDLKQQATDAAKSLLPPIDSVLPASTLSALTSLSSVGSSITGLLSDANKLASSLTTLVQDQVNQGAKQVTGLLDNISKDISGQVSGFINSQVTSSQFDEIKKLTSSIVSVPPTPPIPLDVNGESFPSVPIRPGTDLNSAPVVAITYSDNENLTVADRVDRAYNTVTYELLQTGKPFRLRKYDYRVIEKLPAQYRDEAIALSGLSRSDWERIYGRGSDDLDDLIALARTGGGDPQETARIARLNASR